VPEPIIIDLHDFIPETYLLRFSIDGRKYEIAYAEARVDEVLPLLLEASDSKDVVKQAASRRSLVTELFCMNCAVGDPVQLRSDLALLPYTSLRDSLDILKCYVEVQARVKKKSGLGEGVTVKQRPSGLFARLRSLFGRAKAD
jgi:hypothetical protein